MKNWPPETDYESESYSDVIDRVSSLSELYYSIEEVNFDAEVEKILLGLGFLRGDFFPSHQRV